MDKRNQTGGVPDPRHAYEPLAKWLLALLAASPRSITDSQATTAPGEAYHLSFYQQLPDFVMALLKDDAQVMARYAPLLYHLIGCPFCHAAYLEMYDAMRAALSQSAPTPAPYSLSAIPQRGVASLCRSLIEQAGEVLRQARRDHTDYSDWARVLLQQALSMSAHVTQGTLRQRALQGLVDVASMYTAATQPDAPPAAHSYTSLATAGSGTRGKVRRRAEMLDRSLEEPAIDLRSDKLEGRIVQQGEMLELQLHHLDSPLRGHYLLITVPLGSLIEPVRWLGGNPHAIRSQQPVDEQGTLVTPLGRTELQLTSSEDRNLLEAMFKILDIRPAE